MAVNRLYLRAFFSGFVFAVACSQSDPPSKPKLTSSSAIQDPQTATQKPSSTTGLKQSDSSFVSKSPVASPDMNITMDSDTVLQVPTTQASPVTLASSAPSTSSGSQGDTETSATAVPTVTNGLQDTATSGPAPITVSTQSPAPSPNNNASILGCGNQSSPGYTFSGTCFYMGHSSCINVCQTHGGPNPLIVDQSGCTELFSNLAPASFNGNFTPGGRYINHYMGQSSAPASCYISHLNGRQGPSLAAFWSTATPNAAMVDPASNGTPTWELLICGCNK